MNVKLILLTGFAGFLGTVSRYLCAVALLSCGFSSAVPTLAINILGSFLIGLVLAWGSERWDSTTITILTTGFLGGFTTFSAFSAETLQFLREGRWSFAMGYVFFMLALGIAACALGFYLAKS